MDNNNPTIYTTDQNQNKQKPWFRSWKIIYPLFGIVLIVEIIFGLKTLLAPIPKSLNQQLQPLTGASISLFSDKTSYQVGENIFVKIKVWTGGHSTSGTDLVLNYNPRVLEASSSSFERGKIYSDYPLINVDTKKGVIRISGVASSPKQTFSGIGELGVLNFKARSKGTTNLTIDYKKGQTNDSNVMGVSVNEDYLEKVKDLKLTIQ